MISVMIIDGHDRRSLEATRSLGNQQDEFVIHVGSSRRINSSRFSKNCNKFVLYPDPFEDEKKFVRFLNGYLKANNIKVLLPMGDTLTEIVVNNLDTFKQTTKILVPEASIFEIARDKEKTLYFAEKCEIPIPKTYNLENVIENSNVSYPLLIKPRISTGSEGVKIANNKQEAIDFYHEINKKFKRPLIQEFITDETGGVGVYQVNLLFSGSSKLVASSVKRKLRQFPISAGPATFFKTVENREIENMAIKLLQKINWVGPAEVEFLFDSKDSKPKLLEINPRFSANIKLSRFAGIDFPYLLVKTALDENFKTMKNVNFDYFCQWFFPGDCLNFLFNKNRFKQEYGYIFNKPQHICHMTYESSDLIPYFANLVAYGISFFNPKKLKRFINR